MSSTQGHILAVGESASPTRFNAKTVIVGTGTYISSISNTLEAPLALATDSSGGFIEGVLYKRRYESEGFMWEPVFSKHLHNADTDISGGLIYDIFRYNIHQLGIWNYSKPKDFFISKVGTGDIIEDVQTTITTSLIQTGTALNDSTTGYDSQERINFGYPLILQWQGRIRQDTTLLSRVGVAMELLSAGEDNVEKIGMEACSSAGATWQLASADGVSRSTQDTLDNFNPANIVGYQLVFTSSTSLVYESSLGFTKTKTNNVPSTGFTDSNRMFRAGIKAMAGSAQRSLSLMRAQLMVRAMGTNWLSYP